ncbi:hypothetical protein [Pseudomonas typographi]|uniref:HTH cro/C1-type domain-containing protein n=1 Tax=Pseudomonas typographi TaxID=2715964 RepID=A0ABR7Z9N7_9PSED|nr:hypothetical protein [Pseudomonas typographi]MBD1602266.1 hypothetical protein [Pseudomonas typographi]
MTNEQKLLPCPFCGSTDLKTVVDDGIHFEQCCKCEATGPTGFKRGDEDAADWNTRAALAEDVRAAGDEPVGYELTMNGEQKDLAAAKFGAPTAWENLQRHGYVISPLYRHPQRPVVLPETKNEQKLLPCPISERIKMLSVAHGGLRGMSRALGIDAGYLSRLANGEKQEPSTEILSKLGLRKVVGYEDTLGMDAAEQPQPREWLPCANCGGSGYVHEHMTGRCWCPACGHAIESVYVGDKGDVDGNTRAAQPGPADEDYVAPSMVESVVSAQLVDVVGIAQAALKPQAAEELPDGFDQALAIRTALDRAACPDAWMRIAVEAAQSAFQAYARILAAKYARIAELEAVQPQAVEGLPESVVPVLKAMARNYPGGHSRDHLDSEVCGKAVAEISTLQVRIVELEADNLELSNGQCNGKITVDDHGHPRCEFEHKCLKLEAQLAKGKEGLPEPLSIFCPKTYGSYLPYEAVQSAFAAQKAELVRLLSRARAEIVRLVDDLDQVAGMGAPSELLPVVDAALTKSQ